MQDIDQNMDELFRRAADNYPLKIHDSRWEDIAPALSEQPAGTPTNLKGVPGKYAGLVLLLLFLSLVLADSIITNSLGENISPKANQTISEKKSAAHASNNELDGTNNIKKEHPGSTRQSPYFIESANNIVITKKSALHQWEKEPSIEKNDFTRMQERIQFSKELPLNRLTGSCADTNSTRNRQKLAEQIQFAEIKNSMLMTSQAAPEVNKTHRKGILKGRRFYFGGVAGALFDEVKNQGLKKTGFSMGLVAGYRFNNYLAFETGLLFANKPYYSTGKYFSMDKMGNSMPAGMEILSLEGKNNVLEIPVKMKYDFLQQSKHHFFSAAGISSYIITHEKNNYLTAMNGVQQIMISSYKNKSRSLAATMDISAGYEHKFGKTNHFRIEPYIQIPLRGMGVGSMPMMSTGLRIGITKFIN